ncbi:MAG: hypothetical protein KDJ14_02825 [Xanthomonadales bacterium]|nr:hypothetical protein [Xanthomonadales bacterium]
MFNPHPIVQSLPLFGGHHCWIIDDALIEPQRWVERAAAFAEHFERTRGNAFPGPEFRLPEPMTAALDGFLARTVRTSLSARRTLQAYSRLSIVTDPPERLEPRQWICHRDRMQVPPGQRVLASVLYLFDDPRLGGTAFFVPTCESSTADLLVHESGVLDAAAFSAKYGIEPGYPDDNAWFRRVAVAPPRFNRIIFYDGALFHSSHIPHPELLSADPRRGRLTLNGFFTCRRSAV